MSPDSNANLIYALLCLVLVGSSLFARRLPVGQAFKMIFAWVGIFAGAFVLFAFRYEFSAIWTRVKSELSPGGVTAQDGTLRIRRGEDGHYSVAAKVNGHNVSFMIDTGATTTSMSTEAARAAGVDVSEAGFPVIVETANGSAEMRRAHIARLNIGPITSEDLPILISEGLGQTNLLGMNFLSSLKGWRVEGSELVLNP
jgi:aspartyl protease family protein